MLQIPANAFVGTDLVTLLKQRAASKQGHGFAFEERSGTKRLTFEDLDRSAQAIAIHLRKHYPQAQSAILCYPPGLDFLAGFFGSLYAGVTAVPAYSPRARRADSRLEAIASDSPAAIVLTTRDLLEDKERLTAQTPRLRALAWLSAEVNAQESGRVGQQSEPGSQPATINKLPEPCLHAPSHGIAVLQYTSGSTALPKGVMLTHASILHNLQRMYEILGLGLNAPAVCWLPAFHDMGLIGNLLQTIYCGTDLTLLSPAAVAHDPLVWLQAISKTQAYVSGGPGFAFQHCVDRVRPADRDKLDLSSWRVAYVGAEPVSATVLRSFTEFFAPCGFRPEAFFPTYGLAEGTLMITGGDRRQPPSVHTFKADSLETRQPIAEAGGRELVACGWPLPDLEVCIVDPATCQRVAPGEIGEVWVAGPSVAAGYWNRPEETAQTFAARLADGGPTHYLRTGDLGFVQDQLFITGRIKELIIIRGRNFYPQDLEDAVIGLSPLFSYHRGAAFTIDEGVHPRLILVEEVARTYRPGQGAELFDLARQTLAEKFDLELDALILVRTGSLPRSTSGKIQRGEASRRFQAGSLDVVESFGGGSCQHGDQMQIGNLPQASQERGGTACAAPLAGDLPSRPASSRDIRDWLVARLARQLQRPRETIGVDQPFASFGLDSVSMVTIAAELEKWLGRQLPQTLLYDVPTIARLAQSLAPDPERLESPLTALMADGGARGPIAIIGLGCRFPGAAGPDQFWQLLRAGRCAVGDVPLQRWSGTLSEEATRRGGFLDDVEHFDAAFFGITPREAAALDPQHRLLLEVGWETLEHAGLAAVRLAGSAVGVFIGIATSDYGRMLLDGAVPAGAYVASGNALSMAANRLSYHLDLRGPSVAVDTACSSSLVAVHLASQALRAGECELALAGGVNLMLSAAISANLAKAQMLSPTGRCQTFDATADGYVRGEGCGLVVLKPLAAAVRDGDTIYAVLEGSAVNQDGRSNGITAPNKTAQVEVIRQALSRAGCSPADVSYVEMHGTGTPLGDPIEFEALAAALGAAKEKCALGAVKTNLGHLEPAAGIASLLKTVLQIYHGELAPHPHLNRVNPLIALADSRFHLPREPEPWARGERGRRAGVSSFGFGGTNAHVIVAEPPPRNTESARETAVSLLPLSAQTPVALRDLAGRYADLLLSQPDMSLANVCATAAHRRTHFPERVAIVAKRNDEMAAALQRWLAIAHHQAAHRAVRDRIAFLFTGQGAQYAGMGKGLLAVCPTFRQHFERCAAILRDYCPWSLLEVLDNVELLDRTDVAQPSLFALEYALACTWRAWGIEPAAVLGHSAGEYVAACIAGVFSLEDGLRLSAERGRAMQACSEGAMLACLAPLALINEFMESCGERLAIAALNGPDNTVVSGDRGGLSGLQARLNERGVVCRELSVRRAFHSALIEPALNDLHRIASGIVQKSPALRLVSNLTGDFLITAPDADYWVRQARQPVRFADGISALRSAGVTHFLEIGPDPTLIRLGRSCVPDKDAVWLASLRRGREDHGEMLQSLAELYKDGGTIRWDVALERRPVVALPTYPFQRQRFWFDGVSRPSATAKEKLPDASAPEWLPLSHWAQPLPRFPTGLDQMSGGLATAATGAVDIREQRRQLDHLAQARRQFDELAADYVAQAFTQLGWQPRVGDMFVVADIATACGVLPRQRRLFERLLAIGEEEGWFRMDSGHGQVISPPSCENIAGRDKQFLQKFTEFEADFRLVQRCGAHLAGVVRGHDDPLHVLFGGDAAGLLERLYERSPVAAFYNDLLRRCLEAIVAQWPVDRPLRVLEVGAGTGGTTAHLLSLFSPHKSEFVFTDVSPLFLAQAREKFKGFTHIQYRLLDVESAPSAQGFAEHQFDLVLAANVLHATSDLRRSLRYIRGLLAPAGLLVLVEGTRPTRWLDLIFGLTDGWWKFTDRGLRPDYPLLSPERWLGLLQEEQFTNPVALPASEASQDADQAVLLALAPLSSAAKTPVDQRNGQPSKNGTSHPATTWLVAADGSQLASLVVDGLRRQGDRVLALEPGAGPDGNHLPSSERVRAIVFGGSAPIVVRERASLTWIVTSGQAPFKSSSALPDSWARETLASARSATCRIDLDPAQPLDVQARCLLASVAHHDNQPAVVFRGDQRFIPQRLDAASPAPAPACTWSRADLEALPPHTRRARLEEFLRAEFVAIADLVITPQDMTRSLQALGLDSLMAIQFRNRLETRLGIAFAVVDFLKGLSLSQLVDTILRQLADPGDRHSANGSAASRCADLPTNEDIDPPNGPLHSHQDSANGAFSLSYNQQSLWFVYQLAPDSPAYNFVFAATIVSPLQIDVLIRAFGTLITRHPALRTRFASRGNNPVQIIDDALALNIPVTEAGGMSLEDIKALCRRRADQPFDLERGPALRVELLRVSATETVLLLVLHHIIVDLWSMDILLRDLREVYEAEINGRPPALPPYSAASRFANYVRWHLDAVHGPRGQRAWEFWRRQLAGDLPVLNLPTDRPRPPVQTYNGTSHSWLLEKRLVDGLRALVKEQGATPFTALLAVFQTLLYRYTGQEDFLVGTATADRARPEWEQTVGYFLNQVALRTNITGELTFQDLVARTRDNVHQALEHQDYPFGLLVKRLQPRRDPSRSPIFQVMFIWDKAGALNSGANGFAKGRPPESNLRFRPFLMEQRGAPFDLTLVVFETGDELTASLRYNVDLFDAGTIERMAGHFNTLLEGSVAHADWPLGEIPMLPPEERQCILETWNNTARPCSERGAFTRMFEEYARRAPSAPAILFEDSTLTYGELNARSNQLARYLQRLGVRRGQTIGLGFQRRPEAIIAIIAAWKMGAPYLFLDPLYPPKRLADMLQDARPAVLIAYEPMAGWPRPILDLDTDGAMIAGEDGSDLDVDVQSDDLAYLIYTSGSTGRPKGTLLHHGGLANLALAQKPVFKAGPADRALQYASLSFDASVFEIVMALGAGSALVLGSQRSLLPGPGLLQLLRDKAVTIATLPPSVPAMLSPAGLPSLHTLIVAGEACSAEVVAKWSPGRRMFNAYGPTEATVWSTVATCVADGKVPSIGSPIASTRAYVLDVHLQPVPIGVTGELYLAGPGIAVGYLNQPELTAEHFLANPFATADGGVMYRTGDLARWRPSGELDFLGRRDQQLKVRGYRVELEEIEEVLRQHPKVAGALVHAKRGKDGENVLAAYVVPHDPAQFSLPEVRASLRDRLPHYMIPASVQTLKQFPLTANGKVDRGQLPETVIEVVAEHGGAEPRSSREKLLADIWSRVLKIDRIGIHDNFFDLGGASIQTLEVVTLANQAGLALAPEMLFRHQTVAELAQACGKNGHAAAKDGHDRNGSATQTVCARRSAAAPMPQPPATTKTTGGGAVIESLGIYLPEREVTTEEVLQGCRIKLDFPLERMTGIRARRMAGDTEFSIDLATKAVADCLSRSAYGPADIDLLVCSNISRCDGPAYQFTLEPTTAARLRARFGFSHALTFDVTNACAGTFTAIHLVDTLLRHGAIRRAMVVSGEYITHLTRTAQWEIDSFMDPRLACLTLGDSGMAMVLERAPSDGVGFQDIDLYTLGKYHDLCVAKASANPEGGAIMFTDPVKSAAITIKEAVKHCLETLRRHEWQPEALKWLIMHQTSARTLDGAMHEINHVVGRNIARRDNTIFHLEQHGNTATNSHFLAVRENIDAGKIASGDKVCFAISGSGQVVGSALYVFDDMPTRQAEPKSNGVAAVARDELQMFACSPPVRIESVGLFSEEHARAIDSVTMLRAAGEACLGRSSHRREDLDLVLHTGTYRSDFLCEPALAAIAAGELGINHDEGRSPGKRTFAFDLTNGAAGTLTGCFVASQLLAAGKYARALILASEVENNALSRPDHLLGLKETASALLLEEGPGFTAFAFRAFPEHVSRVQAFSMTYNQRTAVEYGRDSGLEAVYGQCIAAAVGEFLAKLGLAASAVRWFFLPQRSASFVTGLAAKLGLPLDKLALVPDAGRDYFTSSLAYSFGKVRGDLVPGDRVVMVEMAAGIQVACALYQA
jgi:amino acid adenylation domain-containing protein